VATTTVRKAALQSFLSELAALASSLEIIDVHQHTGPWGGRKDDAENETQVEERVRTLDAFGVDSVCLMPTAMTGPTPHGIHARERGGDRAGLPG